jgi:hypothetical protein
LSELTAAGQRDGSFPDLADSTRRVSWRDPAPVADLSAWAAEAPDTFGLDLQRGQPIRIVVVVEKRTLLSQLEDLRDEFGVPVVPLAGYTSQSFVPTVDHVGHGYPGYGRRYEPVKTTVLYLGDFDPSGEDIERDVTKRAGLDDPVRLGVTRDQVRDRNLPVNFGKETDSRAKAFEATYGGLYQVEAEALSAALPDGLRGLVRDEIEARLDLDLLAEVKAEEEDERARLRDVLAELM